MAGFQTVITDEAKGQRLDVFAANKMPSLSRAFIQKLIAEGRITVNQANEKHGYRLKQNDTVGIDFDVSELEQIPDIELPIIYEDNDVVVIDKPAGIISHSRGKYWNEPSVASFVRQLTNQPGDRAGIVHRLDRATSGVMICSKNPAAMAYLQKQFSERSVKKTYRAIVSGHLNPAQAVIDMPIERNPKAPATFRVGSNGKTARTAYKVIKSSDKYDEVVLEPATGRTHQLRVHLKHLDHPIVGDTLYGGLDADRLFLHAYELALKLPDGKMHTFTAALPKEFNELMETKNE